MTAPAAPLARGECADCRRYENMLSATRRANEDWARRHRSLLGDFRTLLYAALSINDRLKIETDHAEFEGSMNDVEFFRELVNRLHWERVDELPDEEEDEEEDDAIRF